MKLTGDWTLPLVASLYCLGATIFSGIGWFVVFGVAWWYIALCEFNKEMDSENI